MTPFTTSTDKLAVLTDVLAIHVMRELTRAQLQGELLSLEDLANKLEVRKADVRAVVSTLHQAGYVDALRLRVTMMGLCIGASTHDATLTPVRQRVGAPAPLRCAA
jgi:hypothetical protein